MKKLRVCNEKIFDIWDYCPRVLIEGSKWDVDHSEHWKNLESFPPPLPPFPTPFPAPFSAPLLAPFPAPFYAPFPAPFRAPFYAPFTAPFPILFCSL